MPSGVRTFALIDQHAGLGREGDAAGGRSVAAQVEAGVRARPHDHRIAGDHGIGGLLQREPGRAARSVLIVVSLVRDVVRGQGQPLFKLLEQSPLGSPRLHISPAPLPRCKNSAVAPRESLCQFRPAGLFTFDSIECMLRIHIVFNLTVTALPVVRVNFATLTCQDGCVLLPDTPGHVKLLPPPRIMHAILP